MPRSGPSELDVSVASQRRAQIMRAVMASISDEGLEKTTMRNVAERAGVSTGTIAYYFKSKQEMVDAALLEASQAYMEGWYANKGSGPWSLDHLVEHFLTDNTDAGFVLQMIEVGLHNSQLRGTHQEMIDAGRGKIEESLRQGIAAGRVRADIDPKLAAAMLHGVLIWWGSELMSNATSQDLARQVGRLAVRLLEVPPPVTKGKRRGDGVFEGAPTVQTMRALLLSDPKLPRRQADALADAFEKLYDAVAT